MTQGASNEEAAWQALVAHYQELAGEDGGPAPWPDREDLPGSVTRETDSDPEHSRLPPAGGDLIPGVIPAPPQARIARPAVPAPLPADDDDHYVPPDPPPLPRLDPVSKGAWAALFAGPAYLLAAVTAGWAIPDWAGFCSVAAFVGGFTTLVIRMGDRPPTDSGPDDGAIV